LELKCHKLQNTVVYFLISVVCHGLLLYVKLNMYTNKQLCSFVSANLKIATTADRLTDFVMQLNF